MPGLHNTLAYERTFALVKPDGVMRGLIGEIIKRFEQRGLKIIALKMIQPTREMVNDHYPKEEAWINRLGEKTLSTFSDHNLDPLEHLGSNDTREIGQQVRDSLLDYLTMGPVVCMVVEGIHACDMVRKLVGDTRPIQAAPGTIRGDFSVDAATAANPNKRSLFNLIHASEDASEAAHEIEYWFAPEEIHAYYRTDDSIAYGDRRHEDFTQTKL
jgi:nucleoside-diphosphate kinase